MSNPNRTVAAWRDAKWAMIREENFGSNEDAARDYADKRRAEKRDGERVRVSSYKIGPKTAPITQWVVRIYEVS